MDNAEGVALFIPGRQRKTSQEKSLFLAHRQRMHLQNKQLAGLERVWAPVFPGRGDKRQQMKCTVQLNG